MRTLAKAAAVLLFGLLVLALASPFILKKLLPPEKVRALVVAQAQKSLGREVRLGGVDYSIRKGLSLEELAISERPNFAAGTFISVKRFHVRAALLPLLKKNLVVDRVQADGLRVTVDKGADGKFNFSDLVGVSTAPKTAAGGAPAGQPAGGPGLALGVKSAAIEDGELEYRDGVTGDALKITGLALNAKGIRLSGPFDADFAAKAKGTYGGRTIDAQASLSGRFDLGGQDPAKFLADLKKLSAEYEGFAVKGSLRVQGLKDVAAKADLKVTHEGRELGLIEWDGKGRLAPGAAFGVEADGALKAKTSGFKASELSAFGVPKQGQVPPTRVSGRVTLSGDRAALKDFEAQTPVGKASVDGSVAGLGTQKLEPDVTAVLDLDLPELEASRVPGGLLPRGTRLPPMAITGKIRVKGDSATLENLRAQVKQGFLEASGTVAALRTKPRADVEVQTKLDLPELSAADAPFLPLPKGFVSPAVAVEGKARVRGDDAELSNVRLRGKAGTLDVTGTIKGLTSGSPEPNVELVAKLSLPELKASDYPFLPLPAGFALPPSRWDADLSASLDSARFKTFRAVVGSNDVEVVGGGRVSGLRSGKASADLTVKCRQFVLEELAHLTPGVQDMELKGSGFFALSVSGPLEKPVLGGKLQFRTLSAKVSGLKLSDFTGTASFDERRVDLPNLVGKVENGELKVDFTVKNYATKPDVELEGSLTEFDLGKFFAAKTKMDASRDAKAEAAHKPKPSEKAAAAMDLKGKFVIGKLIHPNFAANDLRASWELEDFTPDYKKLSGQAKLSVAQGGYLKDLGSMATGHKLAKVILAPFMVIQKLGRVGGIQIFENFDDISYTELVGDYVINAGLMTLRDSHINMNIGEVAAGGTIDLPAEKLDMTVNGRVKGIPVEAKVGGTFDKPEPKVKVVQKVLEEAGKQLIEGLLKRK